MKKTSVYLTEDEDARLARLSERLGKSRALIMREALATYEADHPDRYFSMSGAHQGDGTSVADIPEEELLKGFGEQ